MYLEVKNVLGIEHAIIRWDSGDIIEVIGPNASGKTSLALCAAAVLAREGNPDYVAATELARTYIREGTEDGVVVLHFDNHKTVEWEPGKGKIVSVPDEPMCCPEAVGLVDFTAKHSPEARARMLLDLLLPRADLVMVSLRASLSEWLPDDDLVGVTRLIEERGWESAEAVYRDRAKLEKQRWAEVSGRRVWGKKLGGDWRPNGYLASWDGVQPHVAESDLMAARDALAALVSQDAITEKEILEANEAKRDLYAYETAVTGAAKRENDAKGVEAEAETAYAGLRKALDGMRRDCEEWEPKVDGLEENCPHCGKAIIVSPEGISKADDETLVARKEAVEKLTGKIKAQRESVNEAEEKRNEARKKHIEAAQATTQANLRLSACKAAAEKTGDPDSAERQGRISKLEHDVEEHVKRRELIAQRLEAEKLHDSITKYLQIAQVLGPKGIRGQLLTDGIQRFQRGINQLCAVSGWPLVTVTGDTLLVGKQSRPVHRCSESERWRTQAMMQMVTAALTNSPVVVLDRADLLDADARLGLVKMATKVASGKAKLTILLCSTGALDTHAPWRQIEIVDGKTAQDRQGQ